MPIRVFRRSIQAPSSGLPFRIRAPLARLQAKKAHVDDQSSAPTGGLGDGEALETAASHPDYLSLTLRSRVYDHVKETPLQHAPALSESLGATVHIKREDLQPGFTFFARCAANELSALKACDESKQLVTASIGSRGHALAWAASKLGMRLTVLMPSATPDTRREAVSRLGSKVLIHGTSIVECQEEASRLAREEGYKVVGAHDQQHVIAACGTVGLEMLRQHGHAHTLLRQRSAAAAAVATPSGEAVAEVLSPPPLNRPELDAVFVSVGGGSLLAGVAVAIKSVSPQTRVIAVEPESADVLSQSLLTGHRRTDATSLSANAEGIFVAQIGPEVFRVCDELVDEVLLVSDEQIRQAVQDCFLDTRAVLELQGAISIAGLTKYAQRQVRARGQPAPSYIAIGSDASNIELERIVSLLQQE